MTVKNPGMDAGANQLPGLTPELVADLEAGRVKVAELNEVQLRQLVEDEDEPGTTTAAAPSEPQAPAAQAAPVTDAAAPSAPAPVKKEEPASPPADGAVDGKLYREKADELNRARQEAEKRERELAEFKRIAAENEARANAIAEAAKNRKGLNDEGYVESLEERLQRLEEQNKSLLAENAAVIKSRVSTLDEEEKRARLQRELLEIETFQMSSPRLGVDLRTKRPFKELDAEIARLEGVLGKDYVAKMQADKAFREQMAAQGHALPDEWEKWRTVMNLRKFKSGTNSLGQAYPSYTSAFVDFSQESGFLTKAVQDAQLEASRETAEKLIQRSTETSVLPAASGSGGGAHTISSSKWTPESAAMWMRSHPTPKTEDERATQMEILKWMEDNDIN